MLILIPIGGCEKEDYTLPVEFNLNFTIKNEAILGGSITIDEISINLKSIDIRGYREQGDDVFLTRNFDQEKTFIIKPLPTNLTEKFNIPQGIYNPISFSFNFQPDAEESDLTEDLIDWLEHFDDGEELEGLQEDLGGIIEDYLEEITPCIMVKGKFIYNSQTKPVILVINDPLTFQILGKNSNGGPEVILDKNIVNNGNLEINPSYWFSVITPAMLNNAFIGLIDNDEYIFLSKYVNSQLYATIFNRMEVSTILTINE
ncbi:MAG: hypothetical protein CVT98_08435 [Bacteroidetes bacterium HGW-Bacteroidetes-15]|nr:MAG: hypothetical protein CVT98_08435 [Bacteroidetes bacterium HGW-Bacteroidetes-15]